MHQYYRIVATALVASTLLIVGALCAKAESANTYRDAVSQCGKEWRSSDQRKAVQKGQGRDAWQKFRAECVQRVGYQKKARSNSRN